MKPVAFELETAKTVEDAIDLLADGSREVKALAGGQSLIPLLNFRLARPALLVDLNRLPELQYIRESEGGLAIGSMTRQRDLERSREVERLAPLMREAVPMVAHAPIRNRGTLGGSLAHADSAAELCSVALALDAVVVARSRRGQRQIPIGEFFLGPFTTALEADELLTEIRLPAAPAGAGWAFLEVARRRGDFALVAVAALLQVDSSGSISEARLAYASMGSTPIRARATEAALKGRPTSLESFTTAGERVAAELEPGEDIHASRDYRRQLARVLTRRALVRALERTRI